MFMLLDRIKAFFRGEKRIAPAQVRGRIYEKRNPEPVAEPIEGEVLTPGKVLTKGKLTVKYKVLRTDGTIEEGEV